MRAARGVLIGVGVAGLVVSGWLLATQVRPSSLLGLVVWLAVAVVLHDAILSPVLFGLGWLLRAGGRRAPLAALAIAQVAALVGGIGSLMLLPVIQAKRIGARNPTVLPLDYAANLAGMWIVLGVLAVLGVVAVVVVERVRRRQRLPAD